MPIVRLIDAPYTRYLRQQIFHPFKAGHPFVKRYIESQCNRWQEEQPEPGRRLPLFFKPKQELTAVEQVWHKRMEELLKETLAHATANDFNVESDQAFKVTILREMYNCLPAAAIWKPAPLVKTTCKKYAVCPWCRYRWAANIISKLLPQLANYKYVINSVLSTPWNYAVNHHDDIAYFLHRFCNRNRSWPLDVVMTVPQYGPRTQTWYLCINIVAFAKDKLDLGDPSELVNLLAWQRRLIPPIGGNAWHVQRATKQALYNAIARAARYSVPLLFKHFETEEDGAPTQQPMDLPTFLQFAEITKHFRTKFHGLRGHAAH